MALLNFALWLQSRAGMISTVEVLRLMEAFVNEPNYTVWSDLSCNLGVLSSLLSHTDFHEEIQEFVRDLFTPIGMKLAWDSKPGEGEEELELSSDVCPNTCHLSFLGLYIYLKS